MAKGTHLNTASAELAPAQSPLVDTERSAEEIRQDIAARREHITETVDRLNDKFHETLDWRTYIGRYPLVSIGVAAGLGFALSGLFKHRPTPGERIQDAIADSLEDLTDRFRTQLNGVMEKPGVSQTLKAAATGYLVKLATESLKNRFLNEDDEHSARTTWRTDFSQGSSHD